MGNQIHTGSCGSTGKAAEISGVGQAVVGKFFPRARAGEIARLPDFSAPRLLPGARAAQELLDARKGFIIENLNDLSSNMIFIFDN